MEKYIYDYGLEFNNDAKILACAAFIKDNFPKEEIIFYTNDLSMKTIANDFF